MSGTRDARADLCRGLALWMIVVNHTPGNLLASVTLKNFSFSDATEAFVLLAGYAGAFAYAGAADRNGWPFAAAALVRRVAKLYVAHNQDGLRVLDISNPSEPRQVGYYNTWREADAGRGKSFLEGLSSVRAPGDGYLYGTETSRGLLIFREQG